jgi:hypothetical protein
VAVISKVGLIDWISGGRLLDQKAVSSHYERGGLSEGVGVSGVITKL